MFWRIWLTEKMINRRKVRKLKIKEHWLLHTFWIFLLSSRLFLCRKRKKLETKFLMKRKSLKKISTNFLNFLTRLLENATWLSEKMTERHKIKNVLVANLRGNLPKTAKVIQKQKINKVKHYCIRIQKLTNQTLSIFCAKVKKYMINLNILVINFLIYFWRRTVAWQSISLITEVNPVYKSINCLSEKHIW